MCSILGFSDGEEAALEPPFFTNFKVSSKTSGFKKIVWSFGSSPVINSAGNG